MAVTHRELDGTWGACQAPDTCNLLYHFPGMTPAEMAAVPERILWGMCEILQPPTGDYEGFKIWEVDGLAHRDYDLPAFIGDDWASWSRQGSNFREHDRPSYITDDGECEWTDERGRRHRVGAPAYIAPDGYAAYWLHGELQVDPPALELQATAVPGQPHPPGQRVGMEQPR